MTDWKAIVSIAVVGVVTILSFVLLPDSVELHDRLVYGLLSLSGLYGVGAGIKFTLDKMGK